MTHHPFAIRILQIYAVPLCVALAACGGGSSDAVKDPNTSIENGKIGDIKYAGSGSAYFTGEVCPTQNIELFGTGTVSKVNGQYQVSMQRDKIFTATCPGDPYPFAQSDNFPISCTVSDEILNCSSKTDTYTYAFAIKLNTGAGTLNYEYHHANGSKGPHFGNASATIAPLNWLEKT